jgi:ribonuclease BN (tRNA processing enzyme)
MKFRVLGCSGGSAPGRRLSGFLLDDVLAIDAGSLTNALDFEAQRRITRVVVTHAHLDHCWSFPLFVANRFGTEPRPVEVHGPPATLEAIRTHLFNDETWPHHEKFTVRGVPLVTWHAIEDEAVREILPGWELTAIGLSHTVPTQGYLVRHGGRSLMICGDTGPTTRLWSFLAAQRDLTGVVIECSFPDAQSDLAARTGHLTPGLLQAELARLSADVPVFVTHVKPEYLQAVTHELRALGDDRIRILEDGQVYTL